MPILEFPISTITDPGLQVDVTVAADALKPAGATPLPLGEVVVRGALTPMVGQFLFQGSVEAVFVHACDRCLAEADFPVAASVVWTFEEGAPGDTRAPAAPVESGGAEEEAHGIFYYDGTAIDLTLPVWDEVALALPVKFLCRDDCRGLCPVCGGNRNIERCSCEEASGEEPRAGQSSFAGLKELFPDLPDQR